MNRAVQLELGDAIRKIERASAFLELQGVEDPALSMSEWVQDRARRCGMMPILPARRTTNVLGSAATDIFGAPGAYGASD